MSGRLLSNEADLQGLVFVEKFLAASGALDGVFAITRWADDESVGVCCLDAGARDEDLRVSEPC